MLHDGAPQWPGLDLDQPTVVIVKAMARLWGPTPGWFCSRDRAPWRMRTTIGMVARVPARGRSCWNRDDITWASPMSAATTAPPGPIRPIGLIFDRFLRAE